MNIIRLIQNLKVEIIRTPLLYIHIMYVIYLTFPIFHLNRYPTHGFSKYMSGLFETYSVARGILFITSIFVYK